MPERAAKREQKYERSVILSAAKDLSKLDDGFEHCEIPCSEPDWRCLRGSGRRMQY
jgi:hypothetical protein